MKLKRKSNNEVYNLYEPLYLNWNGIYGYLVANNKKVYFFSAFSDSVEMDDVSEEFDLKPLK